MVFDKQTLSNGERIKSNSIDTWRNAVLQVHERAYKMAGG